LKPQNKITENQRQNGLSGGKKWLQQGATVQHPGAIKKKAGRFSLIHFKKIVLIMKRSNEQLLRFFLVIVWTFLLC